MIQLSVYFENNSHMVTNFHGTYEEALNYYLGSRFNVDKEMIKAVQIRLV